MLAACRSWRGRVDVVLFAPSVAMQSGPPPEELLVRHPFSRRADAGAVAAVVAAMAGFFTREALQPDPPGLPTLRAFQAAQGEVARSWLARALSWDFYSRNAVEHGRLWAFRLWPRFSAGSHRYHRVGNEPPLADQTFPARLRPLQAGGPERPLLRRGLAASFGKGQLPERAAARVSLPPRRARVVFHPDGAAASHALPPRCVAEKPVRRNRRNLYPR